MMKTYPHEINLGIDKLILANNKISAQCFNIQKQFAKADSFYNSDDISYIKKYVPQGMTLINSILVSTNWNKNDDVFTPEDTWLARRTPYLTPANLNHQGREGTDNNIIGVVASCSPVDDKYKFLDVPQENELPSNFHILVGIYIWSAYFPNTMETLSSKIDKGEMFVSMEAFFDDFGYALRASPESNVILMPRNEITSWLSSYLRCYGGKGKVIIDGVEYQIGRWLKNITFSGVGFVENPANPQSIIFEDYISAQSTNAMKFEHIKDDLINNYAQNKDTKSDNFAESCVLFNRSEKSVLWLTY